MNCAACLKKEQRIEDLEAKIAVMEEPERLYDLVVDYAELLAEQGKIANTPAAKREFVHGGRCATVIHRR
jgi:hypothetical protein